MVGCVIIGAFLDEVEHIVDRFFGVVPSDGRLYVGQEFSIVLDSLAFCVSRRTQ
jgi:hypothetical protein